MHWKILTNFNITLGGRTVSQCAPAQVHAKNQIHILKNTFILYQSERSSGEKSYFRPYKTHEASFSNFAKNTVNFTVSKTLFQITAVDEFDVIKK